jgi:hypothetical protein
VKLDFSNNSESKIKCNYPIFFKPPLFSSESSGLLTL